MSERKQAGSALTREQILAALTAVSDELGKLGVTGEVCVFGGTVMVLAFNSRPATKDVDALFQPARTIREIAHRVAIEHGLPTDWINDGVKGFVSDRHETTAGNLPQFPHLRLTMPVPEYLLAMKCMAARIAGTTDEPSDVADIVYLVRHLHLESPQEVLDLARLRLRPTRRVVPRTHWAAIRFWTLRRLAKGRRCAAQENPRPIRLGIKLDLSAMSLGSRGFQAFSQTSLGKGGSPAANSA